MLTKTIVIGSIEILEDRRMQIREDIVIKEDETELSRTFTRFILNPGDDVSIRSQIIQDIARTIWTSDIIEKWKIKEKEIMKLPDRV